MQRIFSGIQPSGRLTLGNYLGAIRQYIDLQRGNDAYYFVADYHALTSVRDAALLRGYTFDVIADLLALGLDPEAIQADASLLLRLVHPDDRDAFASSLLSVKAPLTTTRSPARRPSCTTTDSARGADEPGGASGATRTSRRS